MAASGYRTVAERPLPAGQLQGLSSAEDGFAGTAPVDGLLRPQRLRPPRNRLPHPHPEGPGATPARDPGGTCSGLQAATALGTPIITTNAIGMDNTGLFYEAPFPDCTCERLEAELAPLIRVAMHPHSCFQGTIHPYVSRAEIRVVAAFCEATTGPGITDGAGLTVSNAGSWAPQGRDISRVKPSLPKLDRIFSELGPHVDGQRIENMEMGPVFCSISSAPWATGPAPSVRPSGPWRRKTMNFGTQEAITRATQVALLSLALLRQAEDSQRDRPID